MDATQEQISAPVGGNENDVFAHTFDTPSGPRTFELDRSTFRVSVDGERIPFTFQGPEYRLLAYLTQYPGERRSKREILRGMYPGGVREPAVDAVDVFVCLVRKRLKRFGFLGITTVRARGYYFGK